MSRRDTVSVKPWPSFWYALVLTVACLLSSCEERQGLLPPSGGRLYEVLLVGDSGGIVGDALRQDVPGLPQSEPQFDVSSIGESDFGPSMSVARNIVKVDIDPRTYSSVRLRYEKNVWAQPQMVVHVNAPSFTMLRDSVSRIAPTLLRLLNRAETKKDIAMLRSKRNIKMEKLVRQMFGVEMWIPMEMTSSKRGKDFLWLSNNSPTMMKNVVIYKDWAPFKTEDGNVHYYSEEPYRFIEARNYMLGKNIKGETDSMHMQTVDKTVDCNYLYRTEKDRKYRLSHHDDSIQPIIIYRGLWEMTGDDMGGPFVCRRLPMKKHVINGLFNYENINVEGFVFAPGKKKRNAIRQLEAMLYTAKFTH